MPTTLRSLIEQYRALGRVARFGVHLGAALLAGVLIMPWLIYLAGRSTLGAYGNGGPFALWADFFRGLGEFIFAYWLAALGPAIILLLLTLWRRIGRAS